MISRWVLICIFLTSKLSIFLVINLPSVFSLPWNSPPPPFSSWIFFFFKLFSFESSSYIFWIQVLLRYVAARAFSHLLSCLCILSGFLHNRFFAFMGHVVGVMSKNSYKALGVKAVFVWVFFPPLKFYSSIFKSVI